MSKIMSLIRRAPKRFAASTLMIAAAIIVPAVAFAWGPSRPTFTGADPAPYVTFNSITDNPQVGDERNFVRIRETGTGNYGDNVALTPGKVYDVSVYYHNNAKTSLNASGEGVATGAKLKMEIPGVVNAGINAAFTGTISAANSKPLSVWDEAYGKNSTNGQVALRYVSNSAKFTSNGKINGQKLPDTLFTTGANLGFNAQDGVVPGCNEFSGFVTFQIRVDQPNFNVVKKVSVDGGTTWADTAKAKAGAEVQYFISYQNTGSTQQDNVLVRDMLPQGVSYTANSTKILNATTGGQFKQTVEGIAGSNGLNAGSYQPNGNVAYKFSAKLPTEDKLKCGTNQLVNTARVTTNAGYKEDTATVTVDRTCKPEAKYACKSLGITQVDRTNFRFTTSYTAENATFKSVTYVIKNAAGQTVDTKTSTSTSLNYAQATAGKYTVQASVTFTVDGKDKTVTSPYCAGAFEVKKEDKDIKVCELATKKIVTIKESQFDSSKYSKNLDDCKEIVKYIKVCELATKKIVTINEKDFNTEKYSKNLEDCKEIVKYIKVCELATKKIVTINEKDFDAKKYSKNLDDCKEIVKKIEVCEIATGKIVIINEKDFNTEKYSKNLKDCATIKVCEIATKKIVTIKESQFDSSKYSKNLKDCEVTPPTKIEVCEIATKQIVTIDEKDFNETKYSKDLSKCDTPPVTPPELPHTGMGENIVAVVGLGALIASAAYYVASRRALNQ